ncbi:hypothetical protein SAMN06265348_105164 [Pedobacter westerhofensis]|uniref:Uncharacterized protein n=1 Tax=Pedobacter westerhofensis TaxID=425512 RepID=A0A521DBG3_9SPHI|nr:hypothetical protein [Pedobacter westerhofensis]SMO68968.1 hypothetical protein SAMN06265348_105164 [Pedobacter westerhofensis]
MSTNENNNGENLKAGDKLHSSDLGETKDFNDLSYNKEKGSYELDVKGKDKDYDHPLPYETTAANGGDDNSDYDEANPYIGDEYANKEEQQESDLDDLGMHIDDGEIVELDAEDEFLARTPEDDRTDLDEEGYPVNDDPKAV